MKTAQLAAEIVSAIPSASPAAVAPMPLPMCVDAEDQMTRMQKNMDELHRQMALLDATTDPQAHRELMQKHMQVVRDSIQTVSGMDMMQLIMEQMVRHERLMGFISVRRDR
jgi:uncharacterized membrane protein (DUF106 family)